MSKIKTEAVRTAAQKTKTIGGTRIKVTVHIPDNVPRRQEKINRIYDILKPVRPVKAV